MNHNASPPRSLRSVCLFGASPETGNQGLNALLGSTLDALAKREIHQTSVFASTKANERTLETGTHRMSVNQYSADRTRRFYQPGSFTSLRAAMTLGLRQHAGAKALMQADAILDLSAGDSFTDLYGWNRFTAIMEPKLLAMRHGIPFILLPQTIGPFQSEKAKRMASRVLRAAQQVWARDVESFELAHSLTEQHTASSNVRRGVDMAFLLEPIAPQRMPSEIRTWLDRRSQTQCPIIGLNVSG